MFLAYDYATLMELVSIEAVTTRLSMNERGTMKLFSWKGNDEDLETHDKKE